MYQVEEVDLPGIGRKFTIQTHTGRALSIVLHDLGSVDIYYSPKGDPEQFISIDTLDDDEARLVSAIMGRTIYKPYPIERLAHHGVAISWYQLKADSASVGKSIRQLLRENDICVIAVVEKDGKRIINPSADYVLHEGSQIAVAAGQKQMQQVRQVLEKER